MGGAGGRLEQRALASVAALQVVEHQEASGQSQGDPLPRCVATFVCPAHFANHLEWTCLLSSHQMKLVTVPRGGACVGSLAEGPPRGDVIPAVGGGRAVRPLLRPLAPDPAGPFGGKLWRFGGAGAADPAADRAPGLATRRRVSGPPSELRPLNRLILCASDSSVAGGEGETIALNGGTLQAFEILPVSEDTVDNPKTFFLGGERHAKQNSKKLGHFSGNSASVSLPPPRIFFFFSRGDMPPVVSAAAHQHARHVLPADHVRSGTAPRPGQ